MFGTLSDRIGRKKIVLGGILLAALAFYPGVPRPDAFRQSGAGARDRNAPVMLVADPATCSFQFNLTGTQKFTTPCDIAKSRLAALSVSYNIQAAPAGTAADDHGRRQSRGVCPISPPPCRLRVIRPKPIPHRSTR